MSAKTKFLLAAIASLTTVVGGVGLLMDRLQRHAFEQEAQNRVEMVLAFGQACRAYAKQELRPAVQKHTTEMIFPAMSATFVARGIFQHFTKKMPGYRYKQATLNPLNPANGADEYERQIVAAFRAQRGLNEVTGYRPIDGRQHFYIARPIIVEQKCLQCHGDPTKAPAALRKRYGVTHGYNWRTGEIASALMVYVPTDDLRASLSSIRWSLLAIFAALTVGLVATTYFMFARIIAHTEKLRLQSSALESAANAIMITDRTGHITWVNAAFTRLTGYSREEAVGKTAPIFKHAGQTSPAPLHLWRTISAGKVWRGELASKRKDGATYQEEMTITPVSDRNGTITHYVVIRQDVSDRKRAERQIREMHEQLVRAARTAGMAEVATGVLHNVGNVLTGVNVSVQLMKETLRHSEIKDVNRALALLQEHSDNLVGFLSEDPKGRHLAGYLLAAGKTLETERQELLKMADNLEKSVEHIKAIITAQQSYTCSIGLTQTVSLERLLDDAVALNSDRLKTHGVQIERDYENVPDVTIDVHKLLQVLVNLIKNADEALSENGDRNKKITLSLRRLTEERVCIQVADNGRGIKKEDRGKMFCHGFSTKRDGHGVGLHSCAIIVRELGGKIIADSDGPGTGAVISVELPVSPSEAKVGAVS